MNQKKKIGFKTKEQLKIEGLDQEENICPSTIGRDKYEHEVKKLITHSRYHYNDSVEQRFNDMRSIMFLHFPEAPLEIKHQMLEDLITSAINKYNNKKNKS